VREQQLGKIGSIPARPTSATGISAQCTHCHESKRVDDDLGKNIACADSTSVFRDSIGGGRLGAETRTVSDGDRSHWVGPM
jgi:hypothetical protein